MFILIDRIYIFKTFDSAKSYSKQLEHFRSTLSLVSSEMSLTTLCGLIGVHVHIPAVKICLAACLLHKAQFVAC